MLVVLPKVKNFYNNLFLKHKFILRQTVSINTFLAIGTFFRVRIGNNLQNIIELYYAVRRGFTWIFIS